jgi:hypothetical protein
MITENKEKKYIFLYMNSLHVVDKHAQNISL